MAKGNSDLDETEQRAARAMRATYGPGWAIVPTDVAGAPAGTHDFELTNGSQTVAVEVSMIAEEAILRDSASWSRHVPDLSVTLDGLSHGWIVVASTRGHARRTTLGLKTWLRELEKLGLRAIRTERWQDQMFTPATGRPPEFLTLHAMASVGSFRLR
ncbi:hypothetical protein ACFC14_13665 [Microbacterium sp. NPDC055988]|uniref:hypothetical protein n=1 Tax=Microbacterium sp. NPDC055988 TaxID=3345671 RepID=UPI0035E0D056